MPSGVKQPKTRPIVDVPALRGPSTIYRSSDESVTDTDWAFQWTWPGLVNYVMTSTSIYVRVPRSVTQMAYTFRSVGTTTTLYLYKNNSFAVSFGSVSALSGTVNISPQSLVAGNRVAIRVNAIGTGVNEGLWVGLR